MENSIIDEKQLAECHDKLDAIVENISKVIIGKKEVIELVLMTLISSGHVLIEDIPGVGKTSLVKALAKTINCPSKRIQFTPDVMPSDVTGFSVYNQKTGEFEFRPGAVMSSIILADEINRASAKTQASLLEAMEEKQVTVDSKTYPLEEPFMVLATQNPIDSFGTYPLPVAQIDRFMMKLSIGYPTPEDEVNIAFKDAEMTANLGSVADAKDIIEIRKAAKKIRVSDDIAKYIVAIINATRTNSDIFLGCSPRGTIALKTASQSYALYKGRSYVTPDDIKYLAPHVLSHRIILSHEAKIAKKSERDIINSVVSSIAIPIGQK